MKEDWESSCPPHTVQAVNVPIKREADDNLKTLTRVVHSYIGMVFAQS